MSDMTLLSVKEVGQLLGLDRATIASWNHADRLPKPEWVVSGGTTPVWTEQTIKDWASSDEFVVVVCPSVTIEDSLASAGAGALN